MAKKNNDSVLAHAQNHVREESVSTLAQMAHLGIALAESQTMEVAKLNHATGKIVQCDDEESRAAVKIVGKVVSLGVAVVVDELKRRLDKDKDNAELKSAMEGIGAHAMHHTMRKFVELLRGPEDLRPIEKRPGDNRSPSDFRVDIDRLTKPSDN